MTTKQKNLNKKVEIAIIGSGMGALTAACLLAKAGREVTVLEQNYLPGGCTSSYFRKGYIFEAGATTVVGLDQHMPLQALLKEIDVKIDLRKLELPMKVYLRSGAVLNRYQDLEAWIAEAERVFGKKGQRPFWEYCYRVSQFVWQSSLKQLSFPPTRLRDLGPLIRNFEFRQIKYAALSFRSMRWLLRRFNLLENKEFVEFIDEQLLITAQNQHPEVNVLFGATALCYTNYGNYYVYGGLIQLVRPLCDYIESQGGQVHTRTGVEHIERQADGSYLLQTSEGTLEAQQIIAGIPINNLLKIFPEAKLQKKYTARLLDSPQLNSAFQMGLGFERFREYDTLHHQIHLPKPLPELGSKSIFLSLSHAIDFYRAPLDKVVGSISTHVPHPKKHYDFDSRPQEAAILEALEQHNLVRSDSLLYQHAATPKTWENWLQRQHGFVGGYPQFFKTKPWEMIDARLDGKGAYLCGDTAYPGQGIPGACLSGLIAFKKHQLDFGKKGQVDL